MMTKRSGAVLKKRKKVLLTVLFIPRKFSSVAPFALSAFFFLTLDSKRSQHLLS